MSDYDEISPIEAQQRLSEFHLVDVRSDAEFNGPLGRIENSILSPLPTLSDRANELPKGLPLLLICRSGKRSGKACEILAGLGLGPATNLTGGMIRWNNDGLSVERTEPETLESLMGVMNTWLVQVTPLNAEMADELISKGCPLLAASPGSASHDAVEQVIAFVEAYLNELGPPPDLDLSMTSFRRSLARL